MTDEIACTCKCAPEEHGPKGCKTWYGDKNTGFACNCDWRQPPSAKLKAENARLTDKVGDDCAEPGCPSVACVFNVNDPLPERWTRTVESGSGPPRIRLRCPSHPLPPGGIVTIGGKQVRPFPEKPLRSTHKDRLALDCGRLIIEMIHGRAKAGTLWREHKAEWVEEEIRQEIAQIILKNGFEKL